MRWRGWFRVLHRDVGYVAVALAVAYAVSGLAVNHIDDWNPNYALSEEAVQVGAVPAGSLAEKEAHIVRALGIDPQTVRGHFQETERELRIFLDEGQEVRVDLETGHGQAKYLSRRAGLFEVNALHLNNLKGIWTYVADVFAVALLFLALSGMTMMKGKNGLLGRGKYFVLAGLTIPIGFIVYLYSS